MKKNLTPMLLFIMILALAALACGTVTSTSTTPSDDAVTAEPVDNSSTTTTGSGEAKVTVVNSSGIDVCYIFISPVTNDEYNEDLLGKDTILKAGFEQDFIVQFGDYDLLADDCDQNKVQEERNVTIDQDLDWVLNAP